MIHYRACHIPITLKLHLIDYLLSNLISLHTLEVPIFKAKFLFKPKPQLLSKSNYLPKQVYFDLSNFIQH
jgi:hypothetical protein